MARGSPTTSRTAPSSGSSTPARPARPSATSPSPTRSGADGCSSASARATRSTPERARIAAATAHGRALEVGTTTLCWELPHHVDDAVTGAFVEGTVLAAYRFDRYKAAVADDAAYRGAHRLRPPRRVGPGGRGRRRRRGRAAARDLQNTPANDMTPAALADAARALEGVSVEVHGRDFLLERGMGAFAAVAQGSHNEPALIVLRYDGRTRAAPSSASSARRSPSTRAGSRSSPGRRCTR